MAITYFNTEYVWRVEDDRTRLLAAARKVLGSLTADNLKELSDLVLECEYPLPERSRS